MPSVTREQKLALIVGFSLILFVGVLISDHLSSARKASIAKVEPETTPVSPMPMTLAAAQPAERPTQPPTPIIDASTTPANVPANPPVATVQTQPEAPVARVTEPSRQDDRIASGPTGLGGNDSNLAREVEAVGGKLVKGADGSTSIIFPPVSPSPTNVPEPRREAASTLRTSPITITPVGNIENLKTHSVASGESLFLIAAKYYGNGNMWKELAKFNGMDKSGAVRVGMKIKVPSKEALLGRTVVNNSPASNDPGLKIIKPAPPVPSTKTTSPSKPATSKPGKIELASYTVKRGDTLGDISKRTLGTSKRWEEILELNKLEDEDDLKPGAVLKLPAKKS